MKKQSDPKLTQLIIMFCPEMATTKDLACGRGFGDQYRELQQQQQPMTVEASDEQIEKAAEAYHEIDKIQKSLQQSLSTAESQEVAQQMQNQASHAMTLAVQNTGLDIQLYNQIMQAAQFDEKLRQKIVQKLEELM